MANVFWDTNLFVYLFQGHEALADKVVQLRQRMRERRDNLLTSALAIGEILVKPEEKADEAAAERYMAFFANSGAVQVIPFGLGAARRFASIRRDRSISKADAVHLACAASAGVDLFITNDDGLSRKLVSGIHFITSLERAPYF